MTLLYGDRPDDPPHDGILKVYVTWLRPLLDPTPFSIRNEWGVGYQLMPHKPPPAGPVLGEIEDGIAAPLREPFPAHPGPLPKRLTPGPGPDKYRLTEMRPGQSRTIGNTQRATLRLACAKARARGQGAYLAAPDGRGALRVWRIE
jgi:hypothetical protein